MIEKIAIIVPIYKPDIDIVTEYSITTLFNVLSTKNRDVFFVSSRDMSKENYINLATKLTENYVYWIDENPEYFKSKETYSKMLMSYDFWKRFEAYEYALIYQTDCLLLKDNLDTWASFGYDYIGAPILGTGSDWKHIPCVGNGGLSLRKVSTFLYMTNPNGEFIEEFKDEISEACKANNVYLDYEDLYFSDLIPSLWCGFKKPNYKIAAKFAFDRNPDTALQITNALPDGIHWFDKYTKYYKSLGIDIPDNVIEYTDKN